MANELQQFLVTLVIVVVAVLVAAEGNAQVTVSDPTTTTIHDCLFPNTSMVSTTACSHNASRSMASRMMACLPYLDEDEGAPSAKCCAGVRNVSALSPPCLCKYVFYPFPAAAVNHTRGKLMPRLCNVTASDLCSVCSAFLVDAVWEPHHHSSMADSEEKVSLYKKKVLGLTVVLGFAMACVIVAAALLIRTKLKKRKALPSVVKADFQSKQPGSDY